MTGKSLLTLQCRIFSPLAWAQLLDATETIQVTVTSYKADKNEAIELINLILKYVITLGLVQPLVPIREGYNLLQLVESKLLLCKILKQTPKAFK